MRCAEADSWLVVLQRFDKGWDRRFANARQSLRSRLANGRIIVLQRFQKAANVGGSTRQGAQQILRSAAVGLAARLFECGRFGRRAIGLMAPNECP